MSFLKKLADMKSNKAHKRRGACGTGALACDAHAMLLLILFCVLPTVSCENEAKATRMLSIPGGRFQVGGLPDEKGLHPVREIKLRSFFIEMTEVTNAQYRRCVRAEKCADRGENLPTVFGDPRQPVVMVTQQDAAAYCAWVGRRLPTQWEWERAARGPEGFVFPYGNVFSADGANTAYGPLTKTNRGVFRFTVPVGAFEKDRSGFGVRDMGGNVAEWTVSTIGGGEVVVRGGHWYAERGQSANYHRELVPTGNLMSHTIGFRCAKSEIP
jgi:formylglycine-generating enzyme required for sulfatase activity